MSSYGFVQRSGGFGTLTIVSKAVRCGSDISRPQRRMPVENCSIRPSLQLSRHRPVRRLTDSCDALLETGKRSRRKVAVILNRVPAVFDTADVGFVCTDVIRDGHCGARTCIASPLDETQRSVGNVRMPGRSWHPLANATLFGVLLCRPTAPGLPIWRTGDFGTSPIFGQLSDKPLLASV